MTNYLDLAALVRREGDTEKKVRAKDAYDIVEWIHRLEDEIENLELAGHTEAAEAIEARDAAITVLEGEVAEKDADLDQMKQLLDATGDELTLAIRVVDAAREHWRSIDYDSELGQSLAAYDEAKP